MPDFDSLLQEALHHHQAGRVSDAQAGYRRVLQMEAGQPDALYLLGLIAHQHGKHDEAVRLVSRAIARRPDAGAFHNTLGDAYRMTGQLAEAVASLERARSLLPDSYDVATNLALALHAQRRFADALPLLFDVLAAQPHRTTLHGLVVTALHGAALTTASDRVRAVLLRLCEDDTLDTQLLADAVLGLVTGTSGFAQVESCAQHAQDPFALAPDATAALIEEPMLRAMLPRIVIANPRVERVLTGIRRALLLRIVSADAVALESPAGSPALLSSSSFAALPTDALTTFACALARQCFNAEYATGVTEAEDAALARLYAQLQNFVDTADASYELHVAIAACYTPLHLLPGWVSTADVPALPDDSRWTAAFAALVQEQLHDRQTEAALSRQLRTLTTTADAVSFTVQQMYEENPYPRWRTIERPGVLATRTFIRELRGDDVYADSHVTPASILVAGGGTGRQPIQVALQFADAQVLAVDLSRTSLAYAARKAAELGVSNLAFAQADLLLLPPPDRLFDVISCSGVLHHLADPMAGWRTLLHQLAPSGVMKIGLYATSARDSVNAARAFVRAERFEPTPRGIRHCRQAILDLPETHVANGVTRFLDFYSISGCRDLVMHPQERTYNTRELAQALDTLDLRFLGFQLDAPTRAQFNAMFPAAESLVDLSCWGVFEAAYPATFAGMYQFWCCRR